MAQTAPKSVEIEQIQFKLHTKANIFQSNNELKSNINLLATSSNFGIIFVGNPNKSELKVVPLQAIINAKNLSGKLLCREVPLANIPHNIAINCDGSLLAVNYTIQSTCFLSIYNVPSFMSPNIVAKFSNIPLVNENNVTVTQILWNPVIPNTLAIILSNGALLMYNLKDTNYELFTLDKKEQAKCGSWSPKGKQIVIGFPSGKLVQFKPDLKPARLILCPDNIHDGPFDTIALQWLSTYQFAAVFLQHGEELTPCLYIINAPKVGNPVYINYYDICFSGSGPRIGQIFLVHIQFWNLLLVASANSMEMGILGTTETNETPTWFEYTMSDDSVRLALPMTADKEETYPIGVSLDTGSIHQIMMNENQLPVMPMVHLLSTHGQLVSFDFLNLNPNIPGICSPPQLLIDQPDLSYFKPFEPIIQKQQEQLRPQQIPAIQPDSSFMDNFGAATSTPAPKSKPKQIFTDPGVPTSMSPNTLPFGNKPTSGNLFGGLPQQSINPPTTQFHGLEPLSGLNLFGSSAPHQSIANATKPSQISFGSVNPPNTATANLFNLPSSTTVQAVPPKSVITEGTTKSENSQQNKPLYTIPPTFKPPLDNKSPIPQYKEEYEKNINFNDEITFKVIQEMIAIEVNAFQLELKELSKKSKSVDISIGNMDESKNCTKRLDDLKVINEQAQETCFETDVQILRHSVNECFSMIAEAKSKLEIFENPEMYKLLKISGCDQSNRRKLAKLYSYVGINHVQLKMIQQQMDSNWSAYQDLVHQNSKLRMHVPSLEGIYQTLTTQKDILAKQRKKLAYIKTKLNIRDLIENKSLATTRNNINITEDSLADSILSMSLAGHVKKDNCRLSKEKIEAIRDALKGRKVLVVKPHRPERIKSEVILECKLKTGAGKKIMYCDKCKQLITIDVFPCNGNCSKLFHANTECTQLTEYEINMVLKNKNIKYECDECVEYNTSLISLFESLLETIIKNKENIIKQENDIKKVIEEFKNFAIKTDERKRDGAVTKPEKMMFQSRIESQSQQEPIILSKPAATKPIPAKPLFNESFKSEQVKSDQPNQQQKSALNFTSHGAVQFGTPSHSATDKTKSQSSIPIPCSESNSIFSSPIFAAALNPNTSASGSTSFGAKPMSGNLFGSKQSTGSLFSGNSTEKSAFTIPATFSGFSNAEGKNESANPSSIPVFNIGASPFSAKTTAPGEKQQQKQPENKSIFTPLTGSNSAPTFTGFNLGGATTSKSSLFESKIPVTTSATPKPTTTIAPKNTTDELLENLNICKPTATTAKGPENTKTENIFSLPPTTAIKPVFADLGSAPSSNNETIKPIFSGFGPLPTTTTDSSKTISDELTTSEIKTTSDTSKPMFSGFGISPTTNAQPTNKVPFGGFATNINTTETPKIPFSGFGIPQSTTDTTKSSGFSGFGVPNTDSSKPLFSGFGASVTTTSSEVTKTPFSGFGASVTTSSSDGTKTPFSGFGVSVTTASSDGTKTPFSGFGASVTTASSEGTKTPFSGFGASVTTTAAEVTKTPFSGFVASVTTASSEGTKPPFSGFGASVTTTSSDVTKVPFSGFGASTTLSELTKPQFTGFSTPVTTTTTELPKSPFSGLSSSVTTSTIETPKTSFSFTSLSNVTSTSAAENSKINFSGLGTTTCSNNTPQSFGVQLTTTQTTTTLTATTSTVSPAISSPTPSFGALDLKLSTAPTFGTSTVALDATVPVMSSTITDVTTSTTTAQEANPVSQSSVFNIPAPATTTGFTIFSSSGSQSIFGGTLQNAESVSTSASLGFGSLTVTTTSAPTIFATAAANTSPFATSPVSSTTSIFASTTSPTTGNIFGSTSVSTPGGSIFGGTPKPDQSVFSNTATPFGTQTNSGGSIFGGANTSTQPASPFGQQASPFQSSSTSIFGGQKTDGNIFGAAATQSSGGSIFGQQTTSPFWVPQETSQTSIFGTNQSLPTEPSSFGGGSIFGGANQNISSPFGGGSTQNSGFGTGLFSTGGSSGGAFSGFGASPSSGAFAQGGPSIAQTGFGSPNSSFSKPAGVFGGTPAFGSPPTFGSSPSFGGPPSFGGFGSAQATGGSSPPAFSAPTQKNNLFEALGSSGDNVSSFGNLAQSANQNTAKPAFPGGSSFSSWR